MLSSSAAAPPASPYRVPPLRGLEHDRARPRGGRHRRCGRGFDSEYRPFCVRGLTHDRRCGGRSSKAHHTSTCCCSHVRPRPAAKCTPPPRCALCIRVARRDPADAPCAQNAGASPVELTSSATPERVSRRLYFFSDNSPTRTSH
ncbi:hypothetical protein OH77DRAFT_805230 [Trametes cingulata]|nr:hypothetical protein OH77DRAFT_805230 [Trametes cingulata]